MKEDFIFSHTIDTEAGSSGSPIILFTKKVIGIHRGYDNDLMNIGICIDGVIKILNENIKKERKAENEIKLVDDLFLVHLSFFQK